jgi:ABC-type bacteriocin/lantibiotic exporter with double-glycine peptidase domain
MPLDGLRTAVSSVLAALASAAVILGSSGVMLDVPFVAQPKNGCGAASIAMVIEYWERSAGQSHSRQAEVGAIQRALYSPPSRGIRASAMQRYFKDAGYRTFPLHGAWADLKENLQKGRPLIVALAPEGPHDPWHYVVVAGMDWENDWVFVNDPARRKLLKVGRAEFEKQWAVTQDWTLLAVPRQTKEDKSSP